MEALARRQAAARSRAHRPVVSGVPHHHFNALETVLALVAIAVWGLVVPLSLLSSITPFAGFG